MVFDRDRHTGGPR